MIAAAQPFVQMALRVAPVVGGMAVLAWRIQETRRPVSARSILIPPLGMATGFSMFVVPAMRIPWLWAAVAFLAGFLLLAEPLLRSSELYRSGDQVLLRRSNVFLLVLLGLLGLRLGLHEYVNHIISARQTAGVFFVLAFGMILRWRATMYLRFRSLSRD